MTRVTKVLAVGPGVLFSTVITCAVGALLPPLIGGVLFFGGLGCGVALAVGIAEDLAVRVLVGGRGLSKEEAAAVAPASQSSRFVFAASWSASTFCRTLGHVLLLAGYLLILCGVQAAAYVLPEIAKPIPLTSTTSSPMDTARGTASATARTPCASP